MLGSPTSPMSSSIEATSAASTLPPTKFISSPKGGASVAIPFNPLPPTTQQARPINAASVADLGGMTTKNPPAPIACASSAALILPDATRLSNTNDAARPAPLCAGHRPCDTQSPRASAPLCPDQCFRDTQTLGVGASPCDRHLAGELHTWIAVAELNGSQSETDAHLPAAAVELFFTSPELAVAA